jgi:hypothetical protein
MVKISHGPVCQQLMVMAQSKTTDCNLKGLSGNLRSLVFVTSALTLCAEIVILLMQSRMAGKAVAILAVLALAVAANAQNTAQVINKLTPLTIKLAV